MKYIFTKGTIYGVGLELNDNLTFQEEKKKTYVEDINGPRVALKAKFIFTLLRDLSFQDKKNWRMKSKVVATLLFTFLLMFLVQQDADCVSSPRFKGRRLNGKRSEVKQQSP